MSIPGCDYSTGHPSIASMKAAGIRFACRYASDSAAADASGKNLMKPELTALLAAGISVVIVEESTASRMLGGRPAGIADAQHGDAVCSGLGMPGLPVYFACDFDASLAQQTQINAYLDGAISVIGLPRTGIYGGYYPVKRALDAGKARWAWQAFAWSGGQWDPRAHIRQVKNDVSMGGGTVDLDTAMTTDYGQWPRPAPAKPPTIPATPEGDSMVYPGIPGVWLDARQYVDAHGTEWVAGLGTNGLMYATYKKAAAGGVLPAKWTAPAVIPSP